MPDDVLFRSVQLGPTSLRFHELGNNVARGIERNLIYLGLDFDIFTIAETVTAAASSVRKRAPRQGLRDAAILKT